MLAIQIYQRKAVKCSFKVKKKKVKVLCLGKNKNKERKKPHAEIAKIYGENKSSIWEIVKEKEICATFAIALQTVKVRARKHVSVYLFSSLHLIARALYHLTSTPKGRSVVHNEIF